MLHVWNIYLHLVDFWGKCRDSYSIHGAYGFGWNCTPPSTSATLHLLAFPLGFPFRSRKKVRMLRQHAHDFRLKPDMLVAMGHSAGFGPFFGKPRMRLYS